METRSREKTFISNTVTQKQNHQGLRFSFLSRSECSLISTSLSASLIVPWLPLLTHGLIWWPHSLSLSHYSAWLPEADTLALSVSPLQIYRRRIRLSQLIF